MKKIVKQIAGKPLQRPVTSILNQAFKYTNSAETNLSKRFAEIRAAQESAKQPSIIVAIGRKAK